MELLRFCKNDQVKSVLIRKYRNYAGNCGCQIIYADENGSHIGVQSFKTYDDAVCYFFFECGLTKEKHYKNSVILER